MIDLKKYGLLYRLHCLQGAQAVEDDELALVDTYFSEGLVAGGRTNYLAGAPSVALTPDGHLLVQVIKRQIRFSISSLLPKPSTKVPRDLRSTALEQE